MSEVPLSKKRQESPSSDRPIDFETALIDIESTVRQLESGELSLDASLEKYQTAVGQLRHCYGLLEAAERKISVLSGFDADGNPVTQPYDDEDQTLQQKQAARGQRRSATVAVSDPTDEDAG